MAKASHMMIRALDEARSVDFYRRAFGLEVADRLTFDGFTLIYLSNSESDFEVELTINHDRTEPYVLGDGYGHVAFVTADLATDHAHLEKGGLNPGPVKEFYKDGQLLAKFFFVQDPDGYKVEVLQKHGRYQ